jgi:tRNA pseudouridine55 synthase
MTTAGLVIVDKPMGWTSHDVVARIRRIAGTRRVGHAGTLDPMATGVLVVAVAKATRLLPYLPLTDKAYTATMRLGESTTTDDAQGEIVTRWPAAAVTEQAVRDVLTRFTGDLNQVPSAVSAIKIGGRRAYARVRAGEEPTLSPRPVTVRRFDATGFAREGDVLDVDVIVECSAGTYVRALARDVGTALDVGGHLTALRRTRVGPFTLADARSVAELESLADPVAVPLDIAVRTMLPVREVSADEATELRHGRAITGSGEGQPSGAFAPDGTVIAVVRDEGQLARPILVFEPAG